MVFLSSSQASSNWKLRSHPLEKKDPIERPKRYQLTDAITNEICQPCIFIRN